MGLPCLPLAVDLAVVERGQQEGHAPREDVLDARDADGRTPAHVAAAAGGARAGPTLRALAAARADLDVADRLGQRVAHLVARARCADGEVPRDKTRGMTIRPAAPTSAAWRACATALRVLTAPVPTITRNPACTSRATPSCRHASSSNGQSPIDPQ